MRRTKRRGQHRSFWAEVVDAQRSIERYRPLTDLWHWWKRGRLPSVPVSERLRMKHEREATDEEKSGPRDSKERRGAAS